MVVSLQQTRDGRGVAEGQPLLTDPVLAAQLGGKTVPAQVVLSATQARTRWVGGQDWPSPPTSRLAWSGPAVRYLDRLARTDRPASAGVVEAAYGLLGHWAAGVPGPEAAFDSDRHLARQGPCTLVYRVLGSEVVIEAVAIAR
jgi:hypothetical protein